MIINATEINQDTTKLCELMSKHGSDKSSCVHNYTIVYNELFKNLKNTTRNFFELGIGTINSGASLRAWKDYFEKANIYGADILDEALFTEHRIQTFQCDQLDKKSISKLWDNFKDTEFDVILEDGLHTYEANIHFFENSFFKVKKGGYYIIEDIVEKYTFLYEDYFEKCKNQFEEYQIIKLDNDINPIDNVLLIIKK